MVTRINLPDNDTVSGRALARHIDTIDIGPDVTLTSRALVERTGLPQPYPELVERILGISDELEIAARCRAPDVLRSQWNPLSGMYLFEFESRLASSPPTLRKRGIARAMELKANVLYRVVHEVAHVMFYDVAMRGLMKTLVREHGPSTPAHAVHVFGEMFAEFTSHYELGVATYPYWSNYWRPIAESSEGQSVNCGIAAVRAGLDRPSQRAMLIASAYSGSAERPAPLSADELLASTELCAQWLVQRGYAEKTVRSAMTWWNGYWSAPPMRRFVEDFVSDEVSLIWLDGERDPCEVRTLRELCARMIDLVYRWRRPPPAIARHLATRRVLQRCALVVCQLERLTSFPGLRVTRAVRATLERTIAVSRERLAVAWRAAAVRLGSLSLASCKRLRAAAANTVSTLRASLTRTTGAYVAFDHPALTGASMTDAPMDFRILEADGRGISLETRAAMLRTVLDELAAHDRLLGPDHTLRRHVIAGAALDAEIRLATTAQTAKRSRQLGARIAEWYEAARAARVLVRCYRWAWIEEEPFLDPLVGFRIK